MTITSELDRLWQLDRGIGLPEARNEEFFQSLGAFADPSDDPARDAACASYSNYLDLGGDLLDNKQNAVLAVVLFSGLGAGIGALFFGTRGALVGASIGLGAAALELNREYTTWKATHCGV